MRKFTLLIITIISIFLLTGCFKIGGNTPTNPVTETPTPVVAEYTVTFMDGDKIHKTYTVKENEKVNKPVDPIKDGYVFICWSTSSQVKNEFDFDNAITKDITIYAFWDKAKEPTSEPTPEPTPIVKYTVTL